jgi:alcohol dehydrogenase class IV
MSLASYYGGLCLGPVNTTAGHAIAYPLGSRHGLPHGIANALIFPHVLAANATSSSEKTTLISQALGLEFVTPYTLEQSSLEYCAALGISMKIRDYNVPENDLKEMADEAANIRRLMDWNPVDLAASDVHRIYQSAW